jgi:hypothetical protein
MKKKKTKNHFEINLIFSLLILSLIIIQVIFSLIEKNAGLVAGEASDSIIVSVAVVPSISIDSPSNVNLSPDIEETGSATGNATWNVKTNNSDGWMLEVNADSTPALQDGGNTFADYTEGTPGTPDAWSINAADSEFGFSASGLYAETGYNNGTRFLGFDGSNQIQVSHRDAPSAGGGDDTTVNFQAEVGSGHNQPIGTYFATITATATTL